MRGNNNNFLYVATAAAEAIGAASTLIPLIDQTNPDASIGSKYDLADRAFSGVPTPYNLPVPLYHFVNDTPFGLERIRPTSISTFLGFDNYERPKYRALSEHRGCVWAGSAPFISWPAG